MRIRFCLVSEATLYWDPRSANNMNHPDAQKEINNILILIDLRNHNQNTEVAALRNSTNCLSPENF